MKEQLRILKESHVGSEEPLSTMTKEQEEAMIDEENQSFGTPIHEENLIIEGAGVVEEDRDMT